MDGEGETKTNLPRTMRDDANSHKSFCCPLLPLEGCISSVTVPGSPSSFLHLKYLLSLDYKGK